MSEIKLVSPLLDGFVMGDPMSSHDGVRCCPAMKENSDDKYIVKIISVPASQKQLDALLLTGAYKDAAAATEYFKELADGVVKEAETLQQLSKLEGFLPYQGWQIVPMEDGKLGYNVYLLSSYKRSLEKYLRRNPMTHLGAVNLGLDLCAALAICRRAGFMFIDLKPSNIYLTGDREYRIGDLGFASLKSLKYANLPSKYRSCYTAPELHDALATLNPTADIYALGMILYQIYNNGQLPFQNRAPAEELPAPLNADYEMAEIIMKACAPDPRVRWQNPIEMGKALVGYMQRNTVNDVPIVPPVVQSAPVIRDEEEEEDLLAGNPAAAAESGVREESEPQQTIPAEEESFDDPHTQDASDHLPADIPAEKPDTGEQNLYSGELAFLNDMISDETAPDADGGEEVSNGAMTDEVNFMLAQADELIARETPQSVVIPEPEEITIPMNTDKGDADLNVDDLFPADDDAEAPIEEDAQETEEFEEYEKPHRKAHSWLAAIAIILLLALVGGGGFYFYTNYYLLPIDRLDVTGLENSITVQLIADVDESILTVVCTDTYGNTISQPVENGQAVFTDLSPATTYKITVEAEGFHALSGSYTGSYTTKEETNIVSFTAVTGTEDGSVILNFTVDGRETQDWMVEYSTEGEEPQSVSFTGHMVSVNNLTVGKTYTFRLVAAPASDLYITGNDTLEFTASSIVIAENLTIVSCVDGVLTAQWDSPDDAPVENWTVRCYSDDGYDETITVSENTAQFSDISTEKAYTVEVTAADMAQGARAYVTANPTTVSDIQIKPTKTHGLTVSWSHTGTAPETGWLLMYSIDGSDSQEVITSTEATATVEHCVPGATYNFTIKAADGSTVFDGRTDYTTQAAADFDAHAISAEDIQASLCKTPEKDDWTYEDLDNDNDYTTTFAPGEKASLVIYSTKRVGTTKAETVVMYVIRDAEGKVIGELVNTELSPWADLWDDRYAYLTIPELPSEAGSYTVEIYFDNALALSKTLNISG
ncbi:MAG: fibronectin type III domain-containing protein [Oscillospiraceae bacterium]|nr:fibronectin type III domain-containing protein [Oscillospiraceae bacterium]